MVQYRRIIINNYTEEEHESDVLSAVSDVLWHDSKNGSMSLEECGSASLSCDVQFREHEVEIDVYDYRGAPKYTD
jgi:hypothetical protein